MAGDVRALGDAVPAIKDVLIAFWGDAARVADELPADWVPQTNPPCIAVNDDGGPVTWPLWARPTIRITCYANGKQTAKQFRAASMGALMANPPAGIYVPNNAPGNAGIGYTDARDKQTGADVASFTVTATVPTAIITV